MEQDIILEDMKDAPLDGTWIVLYADSDYVNGSIWRAEVCRYVPEYRPLQPWANHSNDSFLDDGSEPIGWHPLPSPF